ncbi:hypothetical protein TNCV_3816931, partial [Trichonephila clavipes]
MEAGCVDALMMMPDHHPDEPPLLRQSTHRAARHRRNHGNWR